MQHINGNLVKYDWEAECFRYLDGTEAKDIKKCPKCGKMPINGMDACLGDLGKNVKAACCGHGIIDGYILYKNGTRINLKQFG